MFDFLHGISYTDTFYILKGVTAVAGAVMLISYMQTRWRDIDSMAQRMRFITLLWFVMSVAYTSVHQIQINRVFELSSGLAFAGCSLLIVTMILTFKEPWDRYKLKK